MAVVPVTTEPTFTKEFSNTWSVEDLDIYFLLSDRDSVAVVTDGAGNNPDYSEAIVNFSIQFRGQDVTSEWTVFLSQENNVTVDLNTSLKRATITDITSDTGSYTIGASKAGEAPIYRKISVFKAPAGQDGQDGTNGGGTVQDVTSLSIRAVDEGTVVGDTRGDGAIDLQTLKVNATQIASGNRSVIAGGSYNTVLGNNSVIVGGFNNNVDPVSSFIGSGDTNEINASGASNSILGGFNNSISGVGTTFSAIAGGSTNDVAQSYSFIGAGDVNNVSNTRSSIVGGSQNNISGSDSFISGGRSNTISHNYGVVLGSGSNSNNIGETIISNSNSPIQRSIYLLEGYADAALTIADRASWGSQGNIQMPDDTIMSGTIDFTLSSSTGDVKKRYAVLIRRASGSITVKKFTTVTDYTWNGDVTDADISLDVSSNTEIVFNVTGNTASTSICAVVFDTTIMDIYTV